LHDEVVVPDSSNLKIYRPNQRTKFFQKYAVKGKKEIEESKYTSRLRELENNFEANYHSSDFNILTFLINNKET
jgi:hypothetical protein